MLPRIETVDHMSPDLHVNLRCPRSPSIKRLRSRDLPFYSMK